MLLASLPRGGASTEKHWPPVKKNVELPLPVLKTPSCHGTDKANDAKKFRRTIFQPAANLFPISCSTGMFSPLSVVSARLVPQATTRRRKRATGALCKTPSRQPIFPVTIGTASSENGCGDLVGIELLIAPRCTKPTCPQAGNTIEQLHAERGRIDRLAIGAIAKVHIRLAINAKADGMH
jgi:hypothetical protein